MNIHFNARTLLTSFKPFENQDNDFNFATKLVFQPHLQNTSNTFLRFTFSHKSCQFQNNSHSSFNNREKLETRNFDPKILKSVSYKAFMIFCRTFYMPFPSCIALYQHALQKTCIFNTSSIQDSSFFWNMILSTRNFR